MLHCKTLGIFIGGALFGSAGLKLLGSKDAKKVYIHVTAAVLRAKESVMEAAATVQENAADVLASAKDINEERAAQEIVVEDFSCECEKVSGPDETEE